MGCCAPQETGPGAEAPSPCKRVNYTMGMLLGVDDFVQESAYHQERVRELAREMLGYGTVHGLQVVLETDDDAGGEGGPRVRVTPGMAWMPSGKPVCVARDQCANLNTWLKANKGRDEVKALSGTTSQLALYVVLSHAECLTDKVPIPGEPCRDDSELMKESRVTEAFRLEIRTKPPRQWEEDALRDFVAWLMKVPLAPSTPPLTEQQFIEAVRSAAHEWLVKPPPATKPADYLTGAAPAGTTDALFEVALRLWVTELRPLWMARPGCGCDAAPIDPEDDAVLLLKITPNLVRDGGRWLVSGNANSIAREERQRPYLLSLRMVQELVARNPVPDPAETVVGPPAFGEASKVGDSLRYARENHSHGLPSLPSLGGDLSGTLQNAKVEKLQGNTLSASGTLTQGDVLTVVPDGTSTKWVPKKPEYPPVTLAGDVEGPANANALKKILGLGMGAAATKADGQVLMQTGGNWGSAALPDLKGDVAGAPGTNEIGFLQGNPLAAPSPQKGDYLRFVDKQWVPAPADPVEAAGQFVSRSMKLPYEMLAAADVQLSLTLRSVDSQARIVHAYGGIELVESVVNGKKVVVNVQKDRATIQFQVDVQDLPRLTGNVVKLTPVLGKDAPVLFRVFLLEQVTVVDRAPRQLRFAVLLVPDKPFDDAATWPFGLHVELSRFGEER